MCIPKVNGTRDNGEGLHQSNSKAQQEKILDIATMFGMLVICQDAYYQN